MRVSGVHVNCINTICTLTTMREKREEKNSIRERCKEPPPMKIYDMLHDIHMQDSINY